MITAVLNAPAPPLPALAFTPTDLPEHIADRIEVRHVSVEDVTAFVLGGGGVLGAVEVGMLRALLERGVTPDLVLGTSVGALNGAATRAEHTRRRKAAASRFCVKGHPRLLENLLVLSRDADGAVELATCRPCVQPRPRVQLPGATPEVAATAALIAAWT